VNREDFIKRVEAAMGEMPVEMFKEVVDVISHADDLADMGEYVQLTGAELEAKAREKTASGRYWLGAVYNLLAVMKENQAKTEVS